MDTASRGYKLQEVSEIGVGETTVFTRRKLLSQRPRFYWRSTCLVCGERLELRADRPNVINVIEVQWRRGHKHDAVPIQNTSVERSPDRRNILAETVQEEELEKEPPSEHDVGTM